ncbi:DUF305 domain-containing protein [Nonomuraea helvata]|uniref:DUF305 domain-containing protein n=1 Tax=Nonomuraea helvata TaxID=37484 RepID=A0ABV5S9P2_9ACTN
MTAPDAITGGLHRISTKPTAVPETDVRRIQALKKSKNFEYDLLNLLIAHQGDAVGMAVAEVKGGADPAVQKWAGQVRDSREGEIAIMTKLLKR